MSFEPEELFGTKFRALLQRRKNRDLFDLHQGFAQLALDADRLVACFEHYLALEGVSIGRAAAEQRLLSRLEYSLVEDVLPLLPVGVDFTEDGAVNAIERIWTDLVAKLRGDPWKLSPERIQAVRTQRYPTFLR